MEDEMITDYTLKTIKELINTEFVNTMKEYGLPASQHEAFALLNEEIDESYENFIKIINKIGASPFKNDESLWEKIKKNESTVDDWTKTLDICTLTIAELVQVGAMIRKGIEFCNKKDTESDD